MCRHGVPDTTGSQFCHTHLQLAGRKNLIDNHLVDIALIAHLQRTHMRYHSVFFSNLLVRIRAVSRSGIEIEQCRMSGIQALEFHLPVASAEIQSLLVIQVKDLIPGYHSSLAADIEYSHLATGEEIGGFQRIYRLKKQALLLRHSTADNHAVIHRVHHMYLVSHKKCRDQKVVAQTRCVIVFGIYRIRCIANFIKCFHIQYLF